MLCLNFQKPKTYRKLQEEEDVHYLWPFQAKKICFLSKQVLFVEGGISWVAGRIWNGHASRQVCILGRRKDITSSR